MFTNRSQFSLFSLKDMFIIRPSIIKPLKIKGEIVVHKKYMSHNGKCSTVNKCIILCHVAMVGMACLILPLRLGEYPEGARGYDLILPRPTATPSILEGEFVFPNEN